MTEEQMIQLEIPALGAQYLLRALAALNKQGVELQDSSNILALVNMLNHKLKEIQPTEEEQDSCQSA